MESPLPKVTSRASANTSTLLRLEGADALSLLHGIAANALADLAPGQVRATPFCDFRGRLLHHAVVAITADGGVWLVRDDAPADALAAFIDRHVFREDVRVSDRTGSWRVRAVPGGFGLAPGTLTERDGIPETLQVAADFGLRVEPAQPGDAPEGDQPTRSIEVGRIQAGRPRHGHEIAEEFTPFEVGLAHEVHLDKGCFTGQEALMRLVTYRSVRRHLVRVGGEGPPPSAPSDLRRDDRTVGRLTSAVEVAGGRWMGLAVLRDDAVEAGGVLEAADAVVVAVEHAFPLTRPAGRP